MLGLTLGFPKRKKFMISLTALTLLAGLIAGEFTFSMEIDNDQEGIVQEVESADDVAESEDDSAIVQLQSSERTVLEVLLKELEEEQLQEVIEILESGINDNSEVCPELRAVIKSALEEQGQGEISRENTLGNENVNSNSNYNESNNYANSNINPPTNLPPGQGSSNNPSQGEGNLNNPPVLCDNSYWVANTRQVYMLGTPGFWTPRHRCRLCGFTTTCIEEAFDHSKNYNLDTDLCYSHPCLPEAEPCEYTNEQSSHFPAWLFDSDPYYKYTPGEPGTIIDVPDGTYTCLSCGKIKKVGISSSGEKESQ